MGTAMATATGTAMGTMSDKTSLTDRSSLARRNRFFRTVALWVTGVFLVSNLPQIATAGDWELTDSLTTSLSTVDRTGANSRSGTIFQLSPSVRLSGRGGRSSADINYRLTMSAGTSNSDPRPLAHNLVAKGNVDVIENFFTLGGTAAARVSGGSSSSGPVDEINFNADNGQQSFSYGVTPQFRARINRHANFVSNNSLDWVVYSDDDDGSVDTGDSHSTRVHAGLRNGRGFGRFSWQTDLSESRTHYDDRDDKRQELSAGVGYRIDRKWSVRGSVGYEDNDVRTNRSDTNGAIWDVGASWVPNPRTSVSANYGARYFGDSYSADVRHRTRRTSLTLGLVRGVSSRRAAELVDSFFFLVDDQGGILVDPDTGDPVIVNIPEFQPLDEDFVRTSLSGGVTVTGRRSSVSLTGAIEDRAYEVSPIDEQSYDFSIRASRRLSAHLSATVRGTFSQTERDNGGSSDSYLVGVSLSRQLGRRTNASINLQHRERSADSFEGSFTENRIGVSLTTRFL